MLHELAIRSKSHWGYDAAFMALTAPKLALPGEWFTSGRVLAADLNGAAVGVAAILPPNDAGIAELEHLFVDPPAMGRGIGAALLEAAVAMARADGAVTMQALADPQAQGFYARHGFRHKAEAPSDAIPGRTLPLMVRKL